MRQQHCRPHNSMPTPPRFRFLAILAAGFVLCSPAARAFVAPEPPASSTTARMTSTSAPSSTSSANAQTSSSRPYVFRGFNIHTEATGPKSGQPVILVHGFGCSTTYWRATSAALVDAGYRVHALDLLGQGKSDKPGRADGIEYSINLWAALVDDYAENVVAKEQRRGGLFDGLFNSEGNSDGVILIGNSLGSLVALSAAVGDHADASSYLPGRVKGLGCYNCGVGLNSRGIVDEPQWSAIQRFLFTAVLNTLDALLFKNPPILNYLLNDVVTPDLLRGALEGLYRFNSSRVDDELVESFYYPAKDAGAAEALGQIYTNDPGLSPMQLHEKYADRVESLPIHLVWGDDDAVTPLSGGVGTFYATLAQDKTKPVTLDVIASTGHIPFDDNPKESNGSMLRWIQTL